MSRTQKPYPCPDWRAEGHIVKSISHGIWSTVVRVDSKLFTQEGREGTAERIVACVNACEGMSDPAVEISALRSRSNGITGMCAEVEALRNALRGILQHCVTVNGMPDKGKGRTAEQQAALDTAMAALGGN